MFYITFTLQPEWHGDSNSISQIVVRDMAQFPVTLITVACLLSLCLTFSALKPFP